MSWTARAWLALSLASILAMSGCKPAPDPGNAPEDSLPARSARPAEQSMTVSVEGFDQEMRVVLYRTTPGFPLPFSTYVPDDLIPSEASSGEGDVVAFIANFGGHRNDAAAVRLIVPREDAREDDVVSALRAIAHALDGELTPATEPAFGWSVAEFWIETQAARRPGVTGIAALGRQDGRLFALLVHHPPEYGDGFGPRVGVILDEWRWAGPDEPLTRVPGRTIP